MPQKATADGGETNHTDERVAAVETIRIRWEDFKKALRNNYLTDTDRRRGGNTVLRLNPGRGGFSEAEEAETYFSESGVHYASDWPAKPIHIRPHTIIETGRERGFRGLVEWPTRGNTRSALSEEEIEEIGGIDAAVEESREIYWEELRHSLPDTFDLGRQLGPEGKHVEIEWVFDEDDN
ncbi:hypothetical protein [Halobaculum sp. EA56]|uniref:hypothetical protein n=1 Tax=Halobaculum sp. EA56 TaxID=3421648 RepID=UPI003EBAE89C